MNFEPSEENSMILADKIAEERKRLGLSQEELAERLDVSRQAVSKWEGAQSTPDLSRVLALAELFGVTTDYLLKDEMGSRPVSDTPDEPAAAVRRLSLEEANEFLRLKSEASPRIARAVAMCILSPTLLMFLTTLSEARPELISEAAAVVAGMVWLLGLVAAAVFTFISYGNRMSAFEWLEREPFDAAYGVTGLAREKRESFASTYSVWLPVGVVLCVLSALPVIAAGAMKASDFVCAFAVDVLLIIVALGV